MSSVRSLTKLNLPHVCALPQHVSEPQGHLPGRVSCRRVEYLPVRRRGQFACWNWRACCPNNTDPRETAAARTPPSGISLRFVAGLEATLRLCENWEEIAPRWRGGAVRQPPPFGLRRIGSVGTCRFTVETLEHGSASVAHACLRRCVGARRRPWRMRDRPRLPSRDRPGFEDVQGAQRLEGCDPKRLASARRLVGILQGR